MFVTFYSTLTRFSALEWQFISTFFNLVNGLSKTVLMEKPVKIKIKTQLIQSYGAMTYVSQIVWTEQ